MTILHVVLTDAQLVRDSYPLVRNGNTDIQILPQLQSTEERFREVTFLSNYRKHLDAPATLCWVLGLGEAGPHHKGRQASRSSRRHRFMYEYNS